MRAICALTVPDTRKDLDRVRVMHSSSFSLRARFKALQTLY